MKDYLKWQAEQEKQYDEQVKDVLPKARERLDEGDYPYKIDHVERPPEQIEERQEENGFEWVEG